MTSWLRTYNTAATAQTRVMSRAHALWWTLASVGSAGVLAVLVAVHRGWEAPGLLFATLPEYGIGLGHPNA